MRTLFLLAATFSASLFGLSAVAQTPAPSTSQASAHYTSQDTDLGTLLDDPAARAILDKYMPGFSKGDQIDMARSLTLKGLQPYTPDTITDQILAKIDADLAKLPVKK